MTKACVDIAAKSQGSSDMLYSLDFITQLFVQLSHVSPFLTLQWCYILKLMKDCRQSLWAKLLSSSTSLNSAVLRKGGVVLLCDFLCDNIGSAVETVTWLVVNHVEEIVSNVSREEPVQDFVMSVHTTSAPVSGLLLQARLLHFRI